MLYYIMQKSTEFKKNQPKRKPRCLSLTDEEFEVLKALDPTQERRATFGLIYIINNILKKVKREN